MVPWAGGQGHCLLWMKRIDNMLFNLFKGSREGKGGDNADAKLQPCVKAKNRWRPVEGGDCPTCGGGKLHDGGERRARRAGRKCVGKRPEGRGDEKTGF